MKAKEHAKDSPPNALTRFSVSLDAGLLAQFDRLTAREGYPTRSQAIADLMRESLVRGEWKAGEEVAAAVVMVYDHHRHDLTHRLTEIQHDHQGLIIASQHVHLDHHNCLEVIVVRGRPHEVEALSNRLRATKGVKYCSLAAASTGRGL